MKEARLYKIRLYNFNIVEITKCEKSETEKRNKNFN